jgi:tetratricopeptide (TPR) repeat protein
MQATRQTLPDGKNIAAHAKRARGLAKLGAAQRELGQSDAALAPAQEAVDMFRSLASAKPEAFLRELATSLDQLSNVQGDVGRHEAALVTAMEAVDLYRVLAKTHPETFLPLLAIALNSLSVRLRALGRHKEALPLAHGALEWLWPYYERFPDVHGKHVGTMFNVALALHEDLGTRLDAPWAGRFERYVAQTAGEKKPAAGKNVSAVAQTRREVKKSTSTGKKRARRG